MKYRKEVLLVIEEDTEQECIEAFNFIKNRLKVWHTEVVANNPNSKLFSPMH